MILPKARGKEIDFYFIINDESNKILRRYQQILVSKSVSFAEVLYEYVFSYPAIAEALYQYELSGGDTGALFRKQQQFLLSLIAVGNTTQRSNRAYAAGRLNSKSGINPVWVMGVYRLYLSHLTSIVISSPEIPVRDHRVLQDALMKIVYRDMALVLEGYHCAVQRKLQSSKDIALCKQAHISSLLNNIPQILWSVDVVSNQSLFVSAGAQDLQTLDMSMPIPCLDWTESEQREQIQLAWVRALHGEQAQVETQVKFPDGQTRWFRRMFYPYANREGKVVRIDGRMEDTTELRATLERLEHMATTDVLTGLANRTLWYDRLHQALAVARRDGNMQVALMMLDLNHFKMINDTLGHSSGDRVLHQVAKRFEGALRETDTLARLGGDEFGILLPSLGDAQVAAANVANKILECFVEPFPHDGEELYLSAALGIAVFPDHADDADSLIRRADIAMYSAKSGDANYLFYDASSETGAAEHLQLSGWLRHALEHEEFELFYQPKIDLQHKRISGVEALLRLRHPQKGLITPNRFIPIAETIGLMTPITDWVLYTALRQCKEWSAKGVHMPVSVNVSARSFQSRKLIGRITDALQHAEVDGDCLEIEITENTLMADLDYGAEMLARLNDLGVGVAIDDYGTGYSSLAQLKRLPIQTLKIDRSFMIDMPESDNDAVIVRSIIDLGHNLGFKVLAEGVEDTEAWDLLEILGCDAIQGYHVLRPLPQEGLSDWLAKTSWAYN